MGYVTKITVEDSFQTRKGSTNISRKALLMWASFGKDGCHGAKNSSDFFNTSLSVNFCFCITN